MRPALPPGPYLVVGLARSGVAAAEMLAPHGEVIGTDRGTPALEDPAFEVHAGTDGVELLDRVATVVKSPGVPWTAPVVEAAVARGMDVTGELELAWRLLPNPFVAVTGTNGKTTTVELLGAIWREAGLAVAVAGNVGRPLATLVGALEADATVICECSSYQLEDSSAFAPDCAVLLNVEADHLDRHGTLERYREAKLKIFERQRRGQAAVLPEALADLHRGDGELETFGPPPLAADQIALRGAHNLENAAAAAVAARRMGVPDAAVARTLRTFRGVPHRLEEVATVDGVLYVNDSKATNPASAVRGIEAFPGRVHVILGGSLKGGDYVSLREPVAERCAAAYLVGPAAEPIERDLAGVVAIEHSGTLEAAVAAASAAARSGDVVLLSPACASFDAFRDYEHRGERFAELVAELG